MSVMENVKKSLGLDYRSLSLYRALMGVVIMADVIFRLPDLTNFYTDLGLVPRSIFMSELGMPWSFSLFFVNGTTEFAALLFGLYFILGFMLLVGYKSRWAMLGAFVMTVSVHNRNWLVNNGGDDILRAILFISIFLPLDKYFSVEKLFKGESSLPPKSYHLSSFGLTFFLQVFCIYFVSYILKDHPIWRKDFTAIFYASRLDIFATDLGVWMRDFPRLQKFFTVFTIYLEYLGPLFLVGAGLLGKHYWRVRLVVIISFWLLHLGIILTMNIGVFPYTCLAMWSIFLPSEFWDKIGKQTELGLGRVKSKSLFFRWAYEGAGAFLFATLLIWNLTTIKGLDVRAPFWQTITRWLHLYQEWNMFAPFPKMDNIWVEIPALLSDGRELELLSGSSDIYSIKKDIFPHQVPNEHWRKFYLNLSENVDNARYYGGYLCRLWNERKQGSIPGVDLRKFEILVYSQMNHADGSVGEISTKISWKHWCFEEDYQREGKK
jgi:hypothetical protein